MANKKINAGRKGKYFTHVKPRFKEIEKWLKRGATDKEIMKLLGIGKTAFYNYLHKYGEFEDLIKNNRIEPVEELKAALFKKAVGFEYTETKITRTEIELGDDLKSALIDRGVDVDTLTKPKQVKIETTIKQSLPDPASCLILLKHWAKDEGWTNDPQTLELKKKEFELKEKIAENEHW